MTRVRRRTERPEPGTSRAVPLVCGVTFTRLSDGASVVCVATRGHVHAHQWTLEAPRRVRHASRFEQSRALVALTGHSIGPPPSRARWTACMAARFTARGVTAAEGVDQASSAAGGFR